MYCTVLNIIICLNRRQRIKLRCNLKVANFKKRLLRRFSQRLSPASLSLFLSNVGEVPTVRSSNSDVDVD
jgi:hypothetical protein